MASKGFGNEYTDMAGVFEVFTLVDGCEDKSFVREDLMDVVERLRTSASNFPTTSARPIPTPEIAASSSVSSVTRGEQHTDYGHPQERKEAHLKADAEEAEGLWKSGTSGFASEGEGQGRDHKEAGRR